MGSVRLLTPRGSAAVAVVELETLGSLPRGLELRSVRGARLSALDSGRVQRVQLFRNGQVLDQALAVGTGSRLELHVHGSTGVLEALLGVPGKVTSSPAVRPLSWRGARVALSNDGGPAASLRLEALAALDRGWVDAGLKARIGLARARAGLGRWLARPPLVTLVGLPNAGKSTLFNALLGFERALVSPHAGTTRDSVTAFWLLRDVPVVLRDTAGVEEEMAPDEADLQLCLRAWPASWPEEGRGQPRSLKVLSQSDRSPSPYGAGLSVSARTGAGLPGLVDALAAALEIPRPGPEDLLAVLDPVHHEVLEKAWGLPGPQGRH